MVIECPACGTRYEVPDTAIGATGRKVRCAKCRHSWQETGSPPDQASAESAPASVMADEHGVRGNGSAEREMPSDPANDAAALPDEPAPSPPVASAATDTETAQFASADGAVSVPGEPLTDAAPVSGFAPDVLSTPGQVLYGSDGGQKRRTLAWAAGILAIAVALLLLAMSVWGTPDWASGETDTFAAARPDLELDFPAERQERRQLPNGTEFFGASGTVTNTGDSPQDVPPILIVLRDARDRIVYSWEVMPPKRSLEPGETMAINEAVTDVPRSASVAEIGWKPG